MSKLDPNSINMSGLSIHELRVGQKAAFTKTITEADVCGFAGIIADFNPVHINDEYAKQTRFGGRIAHGMLTASFISTVIGMALPGADAIYLGQTLKFTAPVRLGETITAEAEITRIIPEKQRAYLKTTVTKQDGTVVVEGEATIMATKTDETQD